MTDPARTLDPDQPMTLADACSVFFNGRLKPASLRREFDKGNLELLRIAGKDFVTPRALREMTDQCRRRKSRQGSTSEPNSSSARTEAPRSSSATSSETASELSAQDALNARATALLKSSPSTSHRAVKLSFSEGKLLLAVASAEGGSATDELEIDWRSDEPLEIGFNARYLLEILSVLGAEKIAMDLHDPANPALIRAMDGEVVSDKPGTVLMPMRV